MKRFALAAFVALPGALAACSLLLDLSDIAPLAGEAGSPDSASDANAGPDSPGYDGGGDAGPILGKESYYYVTETKVTQINADFSDAGLLLHVLVGDGGVVDYPGHGKADGTFEVDGVPAGAQYYLELFNPPVYYLANRRTFAFGDSRTIDMSGYFLGRPNVAIADAGADAASVTTSVAYDLTGLSPEVASATSNGAMVVFSAGAGALWSVGGAVDPNFQPVSTVVVGASSVSGTDPFYAKTPLVDGVGSGDTTYVLGSVVVDAGIAPTTYSPVAVRQVLSTNTFTMPNGGIGTLSGAMTSLPSATLPDGGAIDVIWDRGSFLAITGDISSVNQPIQAELSFGVGPFGDVAGASVVGAFNYDYLLLGTPALNAGTEDVAPLYGDPYPSAWTRMVEVFVVVRTSVSVPLPDAGVINTSTSGFIQCVWRLEDVAGKTLKPLVSPPKNVLVNGQASANDQLAAGTQPLLTWDPPSTGAPTSYYVAVREVGYDPQRKRLFGLNVAEITTTPSVRQIRIPPGLLQAGHHYLISLGARVASDGTDAPQRTGLPYCATNATTGLITP